jgi:orotate phosphoribosyltransferase
MAAQVKTLKKQLLNLLKKEAFKQGRFVLSSGKISNYYLDGRVITMTPQGAYLTASIILDMVGTKKLDAIGGPTLGADPIVGAVAALSHLRKKVITTFIVRKAAKEHGTQKQVEGPLLKKGAKVIIVDDVATTGMSLIEAKAALDAMGVRVEEAIVIVDRDEGAKEHLSREGCRLRSIFTVKDLLEA